MQDSIDLCGNLIQHSALSADVISGFGHHICLWMKAKLLRGGGPGLSLIGKTEGRVNRIADLPFQFFCGFLTGESPDDHVVNGDAAVDFIAEAVLICENCCSEEQYTGDQCAEDDKDHSGKCVGMAVSFFHK